MVFSFFSPYRQNGHTGDKYVHITIPYITSHFINNVCEVDTDPGVDDIIAMCVYEEHYWVPASSKPSLFALASPEIEILAFIVSFGERSETIEVLSSY